MGAVRMALLAVAVAGVVIRALGAPPWAVPLAMLVLGCCGSTRRDDSTSTSTCSRVGLRVGLSGLVAATLVLLVTNSLA